MNSHKHIEALFLVNTVSSFNTPSRKDDVNTSSTVEGTVSRFCARLSIAHCNLFYTRKKREIYFRKSALAIRVEVTYFDSGVFWLDGKRKAKIFLSVLMTAITTPETFRE